MVDRQIERAAYIAAHAITTADLVATHLVCPGARNTHKVDTIAGIIKNVFEAMQGADGRLTGGFGEPSSNYGERDWRVRPVGAAAGASRQRFAKRGA